ncbi:MAG: tyrosine--tRNA ligase [Pseudonocardiales bacterium]|nr:tyrosine--tRNA ligase [Pseudonocardiales bacterium]
MANDKELVSFTGTDIFEKLPTLKRTAEQVFTVDDFREKLESRKPLRIKYGVDVTAPFLHIGHAVNLWAMREMQEQGHKVVFLIGDFTTRIGDPTGKSKTRPKIDPEQIERDAQGFIKQVSEILITDPSVFEIRRNSEWWEPMSVDRLMELLSLVTYAKLIQRDMFQRRIAQDAEIYMHEMLYPILQGYDSYELDSDLTIVGTDQLFNELMGRFYQERMGGNPQTVITTKITPGIDGREKQSKSLGNYIAVSDTPRDMFGKAMSLPDNLISEFLEVYTLVPIEKISRMDAAMRVGELNPMEAKRVLGQALVERYYDKNTAIQENEWFIKVFSRRSIPEDVSIVNLANANATLLEILKVCMPSESSSELRRLVQYGSVRLGGEEKLTDPDQRHAVTSGSVLRVGKRRWFRIVLGES